MTLWGGRMEGDADAMMRSFSDSIDFDHRLYDADITGSLAYANALNRAGLISEVERDRLQEGLERIRVEFERGEFVSAPTDEDIHTAIERRLGELVGDAAGKLHTGRSRNDQVATSLRIYLLKEITQLQVHIKGLQTGCVEQAETHLGTYMPGYTHMQRAQPVLFSHWLMAYFWKFQRDLERLGEVAARASVCPLGAGALAGNSFNMDRKQMAEELGFNSLSQNSIDAVSDRDFVIEFLSWAALLQTHLSQWAEDLILWSSTEFGFVELNEAHTTGSSLMPQKKNPDVLELIRGKSGRVVGHLVGLLTAVKGLPMSYNKDLQEDKEGLFDVIDTLKVELPVAVEVLRALAVHAERMERAVGPEMLATDLADYLVQKGVPFRRSHQLAGKAVLRAEQLDASLDELSVEQYQEIHPAFGSDVYEVFSVQRALDMKDTEGGTAPDAVRNQIEKAKECLSKPADCERRG